MAETDETPATAADPETPKPARHGRLASGLALIVAAIALITAGYLWYLLLVARPDLLTTDVTGELVRLEADNRALHENLASLEEDVTLLRENQDTIRAGLDRIQNDLSQNRIDWALTETERLLVIANHRLQLARDAGSALSALRAADRQLERIANPDLLPIRRALAREITALESFEKSDVAGLALRLASLAEGVDRLPHSPQTGKKAASAATVASAPAASQSLWTDFLSLVRIRHETELRAPLLPPDQEYFLRENLRLMLYGAQQAILQGNTALYRQNLQTARRWVKEHFDSHAPAVAGLLTEIDQLIAVRIAAELPDISGSLELLRSLPRRPPAS
jgi:uncharacterized protein HemX